MKCAIFEILTITAKETSSEEKLNLSHLLNEKILTELCVLMNVKELGSKGFKNLSRQELTGTVPKCLRDTSGLVDNRKEDLDRKTGNPVSA